MKFKEIAPTLQGLGYETLPLWPGKKNPSIDSWQAVEITEEKVAQWAGNGKADHGVGVRTGTGQLAVYGADNDFYDKDVAVSVRKSFVARFGEGVVRVGQAPKSLMVYSGVPGATKITSPTWVSPDGQEHKFEFLGAGQQFVAFGIHEKTGREYKWPNGSILELETWQLIEIDPIEVAEWVTTELPALIPSDWVVKSGARAAGVDQPADPEERALLNFKPKLDISWDEVCAAVMCLDASVGRDEWYRVLMAISHQCGGGDEGLDLADEWSKTGSNYKGRRDVESVWRSLKNDPSRGAVVTMASVLKMVKKEAPKRAKGWEDQIAEITEPRALAALAENEISKDRSLEKVDLARLADLLQARLKDLGVRMEIKDVRRMLKPKARSGGQGGGGVTEPWCDGYVWCQFEDCFIHVPTNEAVSRQSFNARHNRDLGPHWANQFGDMPPASHVALDEVCVPVVGRRMYLPWAAQEFEMEGLSYLNMYRPGSVPSGKEEWEWSDADRDAIGVVVSHVGGLIGEDAARILFQWIAYCVQHPGRKIRWSPLIKGIEGDGKSLIGELIARVMGSINVRSISPKVLLTDFNGYAEGTCVGIMEELKMAGHNRHDAANALKPNVTNDTIPIHRKGKDEYNIINTMNYIAFTNHGDALPLTDTDRRWWVLFSYFVKQEQLPGAGYFDSVFSAIRNHVGALRGWFEAMDLDGFNPNGRAPASAAKAAMVAAGLHEDAEAVLEAIAAGVAGISDDVISTSHLNNWLAMNNPNAVMKGRSMSSLLVRMGWVKVPQQVKWHSQRVRVWVRDVRQVPDNDFIRKMLDATGTDSSGTE